MLDVREWLFQGLFSANITRRSRKCIIKWQGGSRLLLRVYRKTYKFRNNIKLMINLFGDYRGYEVRYKGRVVGKVINNRTRKIVHGRTGLQYTLLVDMLNGGQAPVRVDELEKPGLARRVIDLLSGKKGLNYISEK